MDDIVERLRYSHLCPVSGVGGDLGDMLMEAAAEITRLREALGKENFSNRLYVIVKPERHGQGETFVEIEDAKGNSVRIPSEPLDGGRYRKIGPLYRHPAPQSIKALDDIFMNLIETDVGYAVEIEPDDYQKLCSAIMEVTGRKAKILLLKDAVPIQEGI